MGEQVFCDFLFCLPQVRSRRPSSTPDLAVLFQVQIVEVLLHEHREGPGAPGEFRGLSC